ncbi:MAG TPA: hypothetical protein VH144_02690, partial [Candidatus Saccharimonadales bacterium]|nr:hypothetical protein [Candidatus Saccharimonadales bacterium]
LEYIGSGGDTYEWGDELVYVCAVIFYLRLHGKVKLEARDDVASIEWVSVKDLDPNDYYFKSQIKCAKLLKAKFVANEI